eukprot:scaffold1372_cov289-Chaetoceros_neogracile.AAC.13
MKDEKEDEKCNGDEGRRLRWWQWSLLPFFIRAVKGFSSQQESMFVVFVVDVVVVGHCVILN